MICPHTVVSSYSDPENVYVCLVSGSWGCIVCKVSDIGDGMWKLCEDRGSIRVIHVCTHEWWVAQVAGFVHDGCRLILRCEEAPQSRLGHALSSRHELSSWEIRMCLRALEGQPRPKAFRVDGDPHQLLSELVEVVGAGRVDFTEAVKTLYAAPPMEENGLEHDEELCGLIEEMAVTDQANTGDLKAYKEDLSRKLVSTLQRQRAWERKQAAFEM